MIEIIKIIFHIKGKGCILCNFLFSKAWRKLVVYNIVCHYTVLLVSRCVYDYFVTPQWPYYRHSVYIKKFSCDLWLTYNMSIWCEYDVILVLVLILYRIFYFFYLWREQASKEMFNSTYNKVMILHCTALHCTALHCTALHCTALHCTALHCTALHCTALHCTALHCTALHCTALHCTALHCIEPRGCKCRFFESLNN